MQRKTIIKWSIGISLVALCLVIVPQLLITLPFFGLAMNNDKSNMVAVFGDIFIAERTDEVTPTALPSLAEVRTGGSSTWKLLGTHREGTNKAALVPMTEIVQDGTEGQLGVDVQIGSDLMEVDYAKLQLIDSFVNKYVDLIVVPPGTTTAHRFKRLGCAHGVEFTFTRKKANTSKPMFKCYDDLVTSVYDIQTLS